MKYKHASYGSLYHYKECGLPNIHLRNGYRLEMVDGEEYLSIEDLHGLHHVIAMQLIEKSSSLTGSEFKYLRRQFNHSRRVLGELLGVDQQTIGRWEKQESKIPKTVDATMRLIYLESTQEDGNLSYFLQRIADIEAESLMAENIILEKKDHHWLKVG